MRVNELLWSRRRWTSWLMDDSANAHLTRPRMPTFPAYPLLSPATAAWSSENVSTQPVKMIWICWTSIIDVRDWFAEDEPATKGWSWDSTTTKWWISTPTVWAILGASMNLCRRDAICAPAVNNPVTDAAIESGSMGSREGGLRGWRLEWDTCWLRFGEFQPIGACIIRPECPTTTLARPPQNYNLSYFLYSDSVF